MRNRLLLFVAMLVLLFPIFWLQIDRLMSQQGSRFNYEMVRVGMPLSFAEAIIGEKASDGTVGSLYYNTPRFLEWFYVSMETCRGPRGLYDEMQAEGVRPLASNGGSDRFFANKTHRIDIRIDAQGIVIGKSYIYDIDTGLLRRMLDLLPLWCYVLATVLGLLIAVYLSLTWSKKSRRPVRLYAPSLTVPVFLYPRDNA